MRPPELRISHDEIICDNFAGGGGASLGIEWALGRSPDVAINHDAQAIAMHRVNHPATRHYCEDVWKVDPVEACRGRPVGLAWFSPDCKHFSKAKGGKPVDKKIRGLAWVVVRWAKAVRPRVIILENVEEFEQWGPLGTDGKPCPLRKGFTFRRWKAQLENLGYAIDYRQLVACEYGTPTTRKRLFLVARRDGQPIVWPKPTHGASLLPYRTAAECIDWALPTYSIFLTSDEARAHRVKRPLAENTMRRIARGLKRFVLDNPQPFIVGYHSPKRDGDDRVRSLGLPLPTQTVENRYGLIAPYIAPLTHQGSDRVESVDEPLRTITGAHRGERALVAPFLTEHANGSSQRVFDASAPLRTQCAQVKGGHFALVSPFMVPRYGEDPHRNGGRGQEPRALSVDRPMPTIVPTQNGAQLVAAFMAKHYGDTGQRPGSGLPEPLATITSSDHNALVASSLVKLKGTCRDGQQLELPLHTVQAGGQHYGEVRAFLTRYNGCSVGQVPELPLSVIDTTDRLGLVTVHGEPYVIADIGMRMLAPRELYRAQGFPDSYIIAPDVNGRALPKDAQVRMVGNSVCPPIAAAVARAQFEARLSEVEVA